MEILGNLASLTRMAQDTDTGAEQQRTEENTRLRRLAAQELASMRIELARALEDRLELHQDLNLLAERLSMQEDLTMAAREEAQRIQAELDGAGATIQRQAMHIARLKKQIARPTRLLAKKVLRRLHQKPVPDNAS